MSPDSVNLIHSNPSDEKSTGYQLRIKTLLDGETRQQLQNIAKKHSLALREEQGKVVIYKPKEVTKTI
jgi:hypothetical protein